MKMCTKIDVLLSYTNKNATNFSNFLRQFSCNVKDAPVYRQQEHQLWFSS